MKIQGKEYRTIWYDADVVKIIDQTKLPHEFSIKVIQNSDQAAEAIKNMIVRGATLIGVMGAYGLMLGIKEDPSDINLKATFDKLLSTSPTAVNLNWSLKRVYEKVIKLNQIEKLSI